MLKTGDLVHSGLSGTVRRAWPTLLTVFKGKGKGNVVPVYAMKAYDYKGNGL